MGAPRARADPDLVTNDVRQGGSAAAVLDFAVAQILRGDMALGALPAVLARLVTISGVDAALAFQPSGGQPATVLAMHPRGAVDPVLLAKIGALILTQRDATAATPVQVTVESEGVTTSALLAYSEPAGGRCLCALTLIGDPANWDEDIRATAHAIAAMVATQIRHANDMAALGERRQALRLMGDLRRDSTPSGMLPERVGTRTGLPRSTTPLAWSHAFAILALRQLWP